MPHDLNNLFTQALRLLDAGNAQAALPLLQQCAAATPNDANLPFYLGIAFSKLNQRDHSIAAYQHALKLNPDHAESHSNLGNELHAQNRIEDASAHYRAAISVRPSFAAARINLAALLIDLGNHAEALQHLAEALRVEPANPVALTHLGTAHHHLGNFEAARDAYRQAIRLQPDYVAPRNNLGSVFRDLQQPDDALAAFEDAYRLAPNHPGILNNLGTQYSDLGFHDHSLKAYRQAIAVNPHNSQTQSNYLYSLQFNPAADVATHRQALANWNARFVLPLLNSIQPHTNPRDPDRRLRIGYVSPDFYTQAESFFTIPLLESHDRGRFDIHCYSSTPRPDETTARIRRAANVWHEVSHLSDDQLAQKIRDDGIDILIDLTMHMANNRALVFARKPAPLQIAWLAFPGSTGNSAIDYRITDPFIDPADAPSWQEQPLRLPETWAPYHPLKDAADPAFATVPPPQTITFGSLNNPCKINPSLLALWAAALRAVPEAKFLLLCPSRLQRNAILQVLQQQGIGPERITFLDRMSRPAYLQTFRQLTLALDTLPYNGITTTLDCLWMGTPVLTLIGNTPAGRAGFSILSNLQLDEFITRTPEEFASRAAALAQDNHKIAQLRGTLRQRLQNSPLMDAPRFAQNFEQALRQAWKTYCTSPTPA